jgi:hypothetical protein
MLQRRTLKVGKFSVEIYPWRHPAGHDYWRWDHIDPHTGSRRQMTAATPERLVGKITRLLAGAIEPTSWRPILTSPATPPFSTGNRRRANP